jgi:hypothetical protein
MLLLALGLIFVLIAVTRPRRTRAFRGRYRRPAPRLHPLEPLRRDAPDPTIGLRDPARPF